MCKFFAASFAGKVLHTELFGNIASMACRSGGMRHSRLSLTTVVALVVVVAAAVFVGWTKYVTKPGPDFIQANLEVLPIPGDLQSTQFQFAFALRYRVSKMTKFGYPRHCFDLVVRDQNGQVVAPSVERPWAHQTMDIGFSGQGTAGAFLEVEQTNHATRVDGVWHVNGRHTLDILKKAWDLKPAHYTLYGRIYSTPPVATMPSELAGEYWECNVDLPPVQIEVTRDVTTQPAAIE